MTKLNKEFYDLSGGINYAASKVALGAQLKKVHFEDATNIMLYKDNGIELVNGNIDILSVPLPNDAYVTGILGYKIKGIDNLVCTDSNGFAYEINDVNGTYTQIHSGLTADTKTNMFQFGDGVVFTDGITEQFIYFKNRSTTTTGTVTINGTVDVVGIGTLFMDEIGIGDVIIVNGEEQIVESITDDLNLVVRDAFASSATGEALTLKKISYLNTTTVIGGEDVEIRSLTGWQFFDRIFIGTEDGVLYWSALGTFNDWTTANDAGFTADINLPITNIKDYKGYLILYHGHLIGSTLMTGTTTPENFSFTFKFTDRGTESPWGVCTIENDQYFDDAGIFSISQVGTLNQIRLSAEHSLNLHPSDEGFLEGFYDLARKDEVIALPYIKRREIWFYFPQEDVSELKTVFMYDYVNKCWFKRVQTQEVTCGTIFKEKIFTGTKDGKILREDFGDTFDGEVIPFDAKTQYFNFGVINKDKEVDEFFIIMEGSKINKFDFSIRVNYDESETLDKYQIDVNQQNNIWDDVSSIWDDAGTIWAVERSVTQSEQLWGSNRSVQLIFNNSTGGGIGILGFEFRDIFVDP